MVSQVALPFGAFCYYRRVRREMGYISARRFPVDPLFLEEISYWWKSLKNFPIGQFFWGEQFLVGGQSLRRFAIG